MPEISPLVSICIPAYNCEKYIAETLHCLLNQSYTNIEVIVADDGSQDNTEQILKSVTDERFKYVLLANSGAAAARNSAYRLSKGDFIKFMDADDLISNNAIFEQLQRIIGKRNCIASSKWGRFFGDDVGSLFFKSEPVWKDLPGVDWIVESLIDTGYNMTQPGIFLIPRDIIERAGLWNESLSLIDDFEFFTRIIVKCKHVLYCGEAVLMYRSGISNSLSKQNSRVQMESAFLSQTLGINEILKIKNDARTKLACANSYQVWAYGFYLQHHDLYKKIQIEIDKLGGSNVPMQQSKKLKLLSDIIGWKMAKKVKLYILSGLGRPHLKFLKTEK